MSVCWFVLMTVYSRVWTVRRCLDVYIGKTCLEPPPFAVWKWRGGDGYSGMDRMVVPAIWESDFVSDQRECEVKLLLGSKEGCRWGLLVS
jgi:hypothetical protein